MKNKQKNNAKKVLSTLVVMMLFMGTLMNVSTVYATDYPPCPITRETGRIIVNFPVGSANDPTYEFTERIVSDIVNYPNYSFKTPPVSTSIAAGNYKVTLFGADAGIDRASLIPEPNEKFFVILNSGATEVARTNSTDDLADGVNSVGDEKVVNTNLSVSQNVDSILAYHAAYPDTSSANSVVPICASFDLIPPVVNPTITLIKTVINDNGGTKTVADFPLFIGSISVASGVATSITAGTYLASETNSAGYTAGSWGGDCAANGSITLAAGDNKTCTITNNDNPPTVVSVNNPKLTLVKTVINDNGGTKTVADFPLFVGSTSVASGVATTLSPGTYTVSETNSGGYTAGSWGGDCAANGSVTLAEGDNKTCTITNNDNAPEENNDGGGRRRSRTPVVLDSSVPPPVIDVIKIPFPSALFAGGGAVNYSYTVTNPGTFALSNVVAADDKCAPINFISGDTDNDNKLDTNESWRYACQTYLTETTTNTITVEGTANGITARDFATANVVVDVPGFPETGYGSPMSSDDLLNIIMFSFCLLLPVFLYVLAKRKTA